MQPEDLFAPSWMPGWVTTPTMQVVVTISLVILAALVVHLIARPLLLRLIRHISVRSPIQWDDVVYDHRVWHRLLNLVPLVVIRVGLEWAPTTYPEFRGFLIRLTVALMILVVARTIDAALSAANTIYSQTPGSERRPLKSLFQLIKLFFYLVAGILIVAQLANQSPAYFVAGLGAMTAVLMLIFQGTILSLVASIQLTSNNHMQIGDWIEMPQFGADGDVIDIALNTVTVRNWDKTITIIPAHKFLENSFKNWRGMHEAGGRQIRRHVYIDTTTVRFLTDDEVRRFQNFVLLQDYIPAKLEELEEYNIPYVDDPALTINARRLTNIGTFRAYLINYLRAHPGINQEMTQLVRQQQPTPEGIPIQIYAYTSDTRWPVYEGIQGDIFDHILAIAPEFGLKIYQRPSGHDLGALLSEVAGE